MGGFSRRDTPAGVPKKVRVDFAKSLVTGISRPLTNTEEWILYWFESHAKKCGKCFDPFEVHRSGRRLCDNGHEYAIEVSNLLFKYRGNDKIYSFAKGGHQEIRVEIPSGYIHVRGLLKAIHHYAKKGYGLYSPKSFDRQYYIPPRPVIRSSIRIPMEPIPIFPAPHNTIHAQPTGFEHYGSWRNRFPVESKRGSLFDYDMANLEKARRRESHSRYNLEIREPAFYRHSVFV